MREGTRRGRKSAGGRRSRAALGMRIDLAEALEDRCLLASQFLTAPQVGPVGSDPEQVLVGDFNGDGKADIVTSNKGPTLSTNPSTVSVLLSNGDGTFKAAINSSA